jgi:hypothetical protein
MLKMAALWVGDALPAYAAACLASFPKLGHPTTLYGYSAVRNVPPSVTVADASPIVDPKILQRYARIGKYSQFSNFFRYELLERQDGICWIDTDVYCLRPVETEPLIFGWETDTSINGAILALPAGHPMLSSLRQMFLRRDFVAPWLKRNRRRSYRLRAAVGWPVPREEYPWGTLGPSAITWYARHYGLESHAKPITTFYSVGHNHLDVLFDPSLDWNDRLPATTKTLHLWHEYLRRRQDLHSPPRGSFVWKLLNGEPILQAKPKVSLEST